LTESKVQYEESLNHWKSEASPIFEKFETLDRRQTEFIRGVIKKSIEFQLDNMRLQVLNYEQMLKTVNEMDVNDDFQNFAKNYAKEKEVGEIQSQQAQPGDDETAAKASANPALSTVKEAVLSFPNNPNSYTINL
jgi:hypothetical protein